MFSLKCLIVHKAETTSIFSCSKIYAIANRFYDIGVICIEKYRGVMYSLREVIYKKKSINSNGLIMPPCGNPLGQLI